MLLLRAVGIWIAQDTGATAGSADSVLPLRGLALGVVAAVAVVALAGGAVQSQAFSGAADERRPHAAGESGLAADPAVVRRGAAARLGRLTRAHRLPHDDRPRELELRRARECRQLRRRRVELRPDVPPVRRRVTRRHRPDAAPERPPRRPGVPHRRRAAARQRLAADDLPRAGSDRRGVDVDPGSGMVVPSHAAARRRDLLGDARRDDTTALRFAQAVRAVRGLLAVEPATAAEPRPDPRPRHARDHARGRDRHAERTARHVPAGRRPRLPDPVRPRVDRAPVGVRLGLRVVVSRVAHHADAAGRPGGAARRRHELRRRARIHPPVPLGDAGAVRHADVPGGPGHQRAGARRDRLPAAAAARGHRTARGQLPGDVRAGLDVGRDPGLRQGLGGARPVAERPRCPAEAVVERSSSPHRRQARARRAAR